KSMASKPCPSCGAKLPATAIACRHCGGFAATMPWRRLVTVGVAACVAALVGWVLFAASDPVPTPEEACVYADTLGGIRFAGRADPLPTQVCVATLTNAYKMLNDPAVEGMMGHEKASTARHFTEKEMRL